MKLLRELEQNKKDKITGLLLAALALLLFISLISYDFSDDHSRLRAIFINGNLDELISGFNNQGGVVGALISFGLYLFLGFTAILTPIGISAWAINRFMGKSKGPYRKWILIIAGFGILLMTLTSLPAANENFQSDSVTIGGWLGYLLSSTLLKFFGAVFSYTIVISLMIMGIALAIPSVVSRWTAQLSRVIGKYLSAIFNSIKNRKSAKVKVEDTARPAEEKRSLFSRLILVRRAEKKIEKIVVSADEIPLSNAAVTASEVEKPSKSNDKISKSEPAKKNRIEGAIRAKGSYTLPGLDLLEESVKENIPVDESYFKKTAEALRHTLLTFGVEIEGAEVNIFPGPIITRFEFKPASGIKVVQIVNLADDLALSMQAERIRIVAPIPGKPAVGVEIPNKIKKEIIIKDILSSKAYTDFDARLPMALGKSISGEPFCTDLAKMPHLLIAGSTGSGKSVCLNCIITSLIYRLHPNELRFILIDPKRLELSVYDGLPHLEKPVVTEMKDAEKLLTDAVMEMENRYRRLARSGVRNIVEFNQKEKEPLPYLVIIVDELADMMMSGANRVEALITRLAQMARAVGIHLVLATQRPSVDVITGLIKANFSSRIAFQVATKVDSRTILDCNGAEKLIGRGDMLYSAPGFPEPMRIHGAYITGEETDRIVEFICQQEFRTRPIETFEKNSSELIPGFDPASDALFQEAIELVIRHKQGSVSLLQRRLGVGYQRAARLIDQLEQAGIVGPYDGSKAREVLVDETFLTTRQTKD